MRVDTERVKLAARAAGRAAHRAMWLGEWVVQVWDQDRGDVLATMAHVTVDGRVVAECSVVVTTASCRSGPVPEEKYTELDRSLAATAVELAKKVTPKLDAALRSDLETARQAIEGALR